MVHGRRGRDGDAGVRAVALGAMIAAVVFGTLALLAFGGCVAWVYMGETPR